MAGLLDLFGSEDPRQQGLLGLTAGILGASGPSRMPVSLGQVLGAGLGGFQDGQRQALAQQAARQSMDLNSIKLQDAQSDLQNQQMMRDRQTRISQRLSSTGQPMPPVAGVPSGTANTGAPQVAPPGVNSTDSYVQRMMTIAQAHADEGDIDGAAKIYEQVQKLRPKFSNDVTWVNGANGKPVGLRLADDGTRQELNGYSQQMDPNKPFYVGLDGKPIANSPYQQYEISKAKAGATNVTTKVENKAAESIASQVGPMLKDSVTQAQGAMGQIDASNRIIKALDTGNVYTGPLASKRLSIAQLGQTLGVGGADDAEKIANTRQLVRGLAELTLQGRKTMQGQGQITDQESRLAEKATSGDIDSLTGPELRIIAQASQRAAKYTVASHQAKLAKARSNPATAGIADYFDMPAMPQQDPGALPPAPKVATLADIAETARKSGKTTAQVTAALRKAGYTIGGQ